MPDTYTGNPSGSHSPSPTPALDHDVEIQVGLDGVDPPSASTLNQPPEVLADWVAFLKGYAATFLGIRRWNAVDTFPQDSLVVDSNHNLYQALSANSNKAPASEPTIWLGPIIGEPSGALADGTITPSGTSTVSYCRAQRFPNSTEKNVFCRLDLHRDVDSFVTTLTLSGAAAFSVGIDGAQLTIEGGNAYPELGWINLQARVVDSTHLAVTLTGDLATSLDTTTHVILDVAIRGH